MKTFLENCFEYFMIVCSILLTIFFLVILILEEGYKKVKKFIKGEKE